MKRHGSLQFWSFAAIAVAGLLPSDAEAARDTLYDGPDGVTCEYFNQGGKLSWANRGGDWRDARGGPQGNAAYAQRSAESKGGSETLGLDLTTLVNEALAKGERRVQVMLRVVQAERRAGVQIHSREAKDPTLRPRLVLKTGGDTVIAETVSDSELNCTTLKSLGARDVMRIAEDTPVVMEFLLPAAAAGKPAESAQLQVVTAARRIPRLAIGVFRLVAPEATWSDPPILGLAARYPGDAGIESDAAVVFASRFDARTWRNGWSYIGEGGHYAIAASDRELAFEPLQGSALKVNLPEGKKNGLNMIYRFRDHRDGEPEEIYFRYYLRLADDWDPTVTGGKLPGIAGTYDKGGWGGRRSDGTNGWSMRGSFFKSPTNSNPIHGSYAIGTYAYHADMKSKYGEDWQWSERGLGLIEKNRWYCIEQYVKLNTPGAANGIMRAWVDGRIALDRSDVRFRSIPTLRIDQIWMNVYHGGTEPSPHDQHIYIDNVVVARQYIGPMTRGGERASISPTGTIERPR
jgi:hypothetical protein